MELGSCLRRSGAGRLRPADSATKSRPRSSRAAMRGCSTSGGPATRSATNPGGSWKGTSPAGALADSGLEPARLKQPTSVTSKVNRDLRRNWSPSMRGPYLKVVGTEGWIVGRTSEESKSVSQHSWFNRRLTHNSWLVLVALAGGEQPAAHGE